MFNLLYDRPYRPNNKRSYVTLAYLYGTWSPEFNVTERRNALACDSIKVDLGPVQGDPIKICLVQRFCPLMSIAWTTPAIHGLAVNRATTQSVSIVGLVPSVWMGVLRKLAGIHGMRQLKQLLANMNWNGIANKFIRPLQKNQRRAFGQSQRGCFRVRAHWVIWDIKSRLEAVK